MIYGISPVAVAYLFDDAASRSSRETNELMKARCCITGTMIYPMKKTSTISPSIILPTVSDGHTSWNLMAAASPLRNVTRKNTWSMYELCSAYHRFPVPVVVIRGIRCFSRNEWLKAFLYELRIKLKLTCSWCERSNWHLLACSLRCVDFLYILMIVNAHQSRLSKSLSVA